MTKQDFATQLIELWDEYLGGQTGVFQPTMTDFIRYIKHHLPNEESNEGRTPRPSQPLSDQGPIHYDELSFSDVKGEALAEAKVAQGRKSGPLTNHDKQQIKELRRSGLSYARIKQVIDSETGLNVPLGTIIKLAS